MTGEPRAHLPEAALDALMARLARGDRAAFAPLYEALLPRAERLAQARLGESDASDVAQTALLKVFARASEFDPERPCLPWFYAIVANELRAASRRNARLVLSDSETDSRATGIPDAEAQMLNKELDRALELALDALDDDSADAIAALLGRAPSPNVKPATLRKRVSRAYVKLRLLLGAHHVG